MKSVKKNDSNVIEHIELNMIDPNPQNDKIFNMTEIEHLSNIIKDVGFTTPIEVIPKPDGRYEIISGHRRYAAMKLLNEVTIPCYVSAATSNNEISKKLISSNIANRRLTPLEMARAINAYKEILAREKFKGNTRKKVAEYFNITESSVYRHECLLKLIPELQEYANKPLFPYSCLRQAANLTKKEQLELYRALIDMEAADREVAPENVDRDDIILSRVRIEQIINNKIKAKEHKKQEKTDSNEKTDLDAFIQSKENASTKPTISADVFAAPDITKINDSTYLKGIESCISIMNGYAKNIQPLASSKEFKALLKKLKESIDKIEAII